jgi:hypothetical protein
MLKAGGATERRPHRRRGAIVAACAMLAGCASSHAARARSIDGVSKVRITASGPGDITEEGRLAGALDAEIVLHIGLTTGRMTFAIRNHEGSFAGVAEVRAYQLSGPVRHFDEAGFADTGTGIFADIRPSALTFETVDDRVHHRITVTVTGSLSD